jgi:hypothetical protein
MRRDVTSESPLWKSGDVRQCDLLAWHEMRNSTSLVADEAFFWLKLDRDGNKGWGLAWIARNPGTDYDGWGYAIRNDAKWMPYIFIPGHRATLRSISFYKSATNTFNGLSNHASTGSWSSSD